MTHQQISKERTDRRRGLTVAIALHGAILALCVYPFLIGSTLKSTPYETVVTLDFSHSAAAASADARSRNPVKQERTTREAAKPNPAPPALPAKATPPVITAPSPLPPLPDVAERETPTPVEVVEVTVAKPSEPTSNTNSAGHNSSSDATTGSPNPGDGTTVSDAGKGKVAEGAVLGGDGVITRAVVFRPRLDDVIVTNGTVVLDICINKRGRVTQVQWNEERSTITNLDVVRSAQRKAQEYRFETDYAAPNQECGQLSISIKGLK